MNTHGLARLYDRLTPRERLPLIMAASGRGDETERERLARSAPREEFRVPDYFGLADGIQMLALFHIIEVLKLTTLYWHASALLTDEDFRATAGPDRRDRLLGTIRAFAYLL